MNEYDLKKTLAKRSEKQNNNPAAPQGFNGIPNSVLTEVFAGKRKATNEMMGHRSNLAPSIAAKMNQAFGMDFSAVQVYQTDAMKGTGMQGMAQGNKVVLSSDVDLNTMEGQAILGHELSHIRAQSMGMGTGNGLLQDAALEHQADNEGLLAAHGQNIYGESMGMSMGLGMAGFEGLTPLGGGMSATAAAPMQAFWNPFHKIEKDQAEYDRLRDKLHGKGDSSESGLYENEWKLLTKLSDKLQAAGRTVEPFAGFDANQIMDNSDVRNGGNKAFIMKMKKESTELSYSDVGMREQNAMMNYSGPRKYPFINSYLRGLDEAPDDATKQDADLLTSGLGKYETKESFAVKRFIHTTALSYMPEDKKVNAKTQNLSGKVLTDQAPMSTSMNQEFDFGTDEEGGRRVLLNIEIPANAHVGAPINGISKFNNSEEEEFLMRPGSRLYVISDSGPDGDESKDRIIHCKAMEPRSGEQKKEK